MATGIDTLSAVNNSQTASISNYFSKTGVKDSSSSLLEAAKYLQGSDTVSFSEEAKKLYADKTKTDTEVIQGLIDKAMDMLREKHGLPNEIEKANGLDALNKRIGDSKDKERLNELLDKFREAFTSGDNRGAALIEKDIAQLFKGLEPGKAGASGTADADKK